MVLLVGALPLTAVHAHGEETEDLVQEIIPEETVSEEEIDVQEEIVSQEEPALQQEETSEEEPLQLDCLTAAPDVDLPSGEELLEGYVSKQFYGGMSFFGDAAGERLTGDEKLIYDAVKPFIKKMASGERTSTVVALGRAVDIGADHYPVDAALTFTGERLEQGALDRVYSALLADLPFELYWNDKTFQGCSLAQITGGDSLVWVRFSFRVADNYADADSYTVKADRAAAAVEAAENAADIVSRYANKNDVKKLIGYKDEICDLVDYNTSAAVGGNFSIDNDPWQLVHVFDGDSTTKVVCEGYSKAFMYLCDMTDFSGDVTCYLATGDMNGGPHMWNIVTLENANYLVDVTNSESGTVGYDGSLFLAGASGSIADGYTFGGIRYTYDDSTKSTWGTGSSSILKLAQSSYTLIPTEGDAWKISNDGVLTITGDIRDFSANDPAPWYAARELIKKVVVGEGVGAIGNYAFYGCENLTELYFEGDYPSFSTNALIGVTAQAQYLPDNATWDPDALTTFGGTITWKPKGYSEEYLAYQGSSALKDWSIDYDGVLTFGAYAGIPENPNYIIGNAPWYPYRQHIRKVRLNSTISKIGNCAFEGLTKLEEVDVGNGVYFIGGFAFKGCTSLTKVVLGERVEDICESAFADCTALETIFIPPTSSITVGNYAFDGCTNLKQVGLPAGITLGKNLFRDCSKLKTIYIVSHEELYTFDADDTSFKDVTATVYYPTGSCTVTTKKTGYGGTLTWTEVAEGMCGSNVFWSYDENTKTLSLTGNGKVSYSYRSGYFTPWENYNSSIETITVGSGITGIGSYAFEFCRNATTVNLPETLTALNANAFASCSSLNNLLLPSSLKAFGHSEFNCGSLTDLYYLGTQERWDAVAYSSSVSNGAAAMTVHALKEVPATATCTQEGVQAYYAFDDTSVYDGKYDAKGKPLTNLQTVPALGHDNDENGICKRCGNLEGLTYTIADGEVTITGYTGTRTELVLPAQIEGNPVTEIKVRAFQNNGILTAVTIPEGVKELGHYAFADCQNLKRVSIPGSVATISGWAFQNCYALEDVQLQEGLTAIGTYAFSHCTALETITLPTSFANIDSKTFSDCTALKCVDGGTGLQYIGGSAFHLCENLESIEIGDNLTTIGPLAFACCYKLKQIKIPASVTTIGRSAFNGCRGLESVAIPNGITAVDELTFAGCSSLKKITIPTSVETIGQSAFADCTALEEISLPHSVLYIENSAFKNCTALTSVAIPVGTISIGDESFSGCTALKTASFNPRCNTIGASAFSGCSALTTVHLGTYMNTIGDNAFAGCDKLKTVFWWYLKGAAIAQLTIGENNTCLTDAQWHNGVEGVTFAGKNCYYCRECESYLLEDGSHVLATITFQNEDGTVIESKEYKYKDPVTAPVPTREHAEPKAYRYVFIGWDKDVVACEGNAVYTASYREERIAYTVKFLNEDGTVISQNTYYYGEPVELPAEPTKEKDGYNTYTFAGWGKTVGNCTGDAEYTATFTATHYHTYTKKVTAPTYTKQGYTQYTCACGSSYKNAYTKAKGLLTPSVKVANDAATGKPKVSWAAIKEVSRYDVYRATSQSGTYTKLGSTTKTAFVDTTATLGKTYYYKVKAICTSNSSLSSGYSNIVSISTKVGQPKVTLSKNTKGYPVLKWSKVDGAKKYEIYYATAKNGQYKKLTTTSKLTYTYTKAAAGKEYFFKVRAYGSSTATAGAYCEPLRAVKVLATPKLTLTVKQSTGQNVIKWGKITGATAYELQCSVNGGAYKTIATTSKLTYTHSGLAGGNTYTYRLRAKSGVSDATSAYSTVKTAVIKCAAPTVSIALNSKQKPTVTWQKVAGAVKYQVYYATAKSGKYKLVATLTGTSYTHAAAPTAKACYYKVVAVDGNGNLGSYSSVKNITTKCLAPTGVKVTANAKGKPVISWNKTEGAKKYEVYVATSLNGTYKKLTSTSKLTYTYTKAKTGTTYYFKITAYGASTASRSAYSVAVKTP